MREVKFRGRDEDGEWNYGDLLRYVRDSYDMIIPDGYANSDNLYDDVVSVDYETVGQFTGLKDHKGHEIYEGDIVKVVSYGEESFHVVKYMVDEDYPAFDLDPVLNDGECNSLSYSLNDLDTKIIVIGNIHDNPELLKLTKK